MSMSGQKMSRKVVSGTCVFTDLLQEWLVLENQRNFDRRQLNRKSEKRLSNSVNENDFVLCLEQNAMDSLVHGVEHFVNEEKLTDLKYTILHVFHAVELFLKARLAQNDPLSIFRDPRTNYTVNFQTSIQRLSKIGVNMSKQNRNDLDALHKIRNSIEHHQIERSRSEIEHYLGRAMYFLDSFLQRELGIKLKDELDEDTYRVLSEAFYTYTERLPGANEQLKEVQNEMMRHADPKERSLPYSIEVCGECGEETIIIPDPTSPSGTVQCFLCHTRFYVETCERCGSYMLFSSRSEKEIDEPNICEYCWDEFKYRIAND